MTRAWMGLASMALIAGCSGAVATTCPSKTVGESPYGACFDRIHVHAYRGGAFNPPPPQGSTCSDPGSTYDMALATGEETYDACTDPGGQLPFQRTQGVRTLSSAARSGVVAALKGVRVLASNNCANDGPVANLTVTAQGVDTVYGCYGTPVDGIAGVVTSLEAQ
ncbi:MAG TPA: hypothetical protein VF316_00565 [Polyangiaceae bacterium]